MIKIWNGFLKETSNNYFNRFVVIIQHFLTIYKVV